MFVIAANLDYFIYQPTLTLEIMTKNKCCLIHLAFIILTGLFAGCNNQPIIASDATPLTTARPTNTSTPLPAPPSPTASPTPSATPTATLSPTFTPSPAPTATSAPTSTPDPYAGLAIADLAGRSYGGGELQIEEVMAVTAAFTRTLISYPSEGLTLYGFMNTPQGQGPFPAALVMHGYIPPENYHTLAYTTRYADALAQAGYLVIHPNYRNYAPSDEGPDQFRVDHAIDVLNLIAIIKTQAGQPGPLQQVDPTFIGMVGHSMGGGITLRTITVADHIQAAVLYGSMSGDEYRNYEKIFEWSGGRRGLEELNTPVEALQRISPIFHLDRINTAVSIHHGDHDGTVPLEWSLELCSQLQALNKVVECFTYPGQPHTFQGENDQLFMERMIDFFNRIRDQEEP